jgi:hypothetical protein
MSVWVEKILRPTSYALVHPGSISLCYAISGNMAGLRGEFDPWQARSTRSQMEARDPAPDQIARERPPTETNQPSQVSRWFAFFVPSVADGLFLTLLLALSCGALGRRLLGDGDTGWHIRNGQLILQTHAITRSDPFSSTRGGQPWYDWEWLSDLVLAGIHRALGLNGVVFCTAAVVASIFACLLHRAVRRSGTLPISIMLVLLALVASTVHLLARPHIVSWLFALVWFDLLDSASCGKDEGRVFWLPALMVLWVNLHGGFLLGLILLGIYLLGGAIEFAVSSDTRCRTGWWLRRLALITLLSTVASLINPFGYRLYLHVYQYLSNSFLMNHISEFLSPNFHGGAGLGFIALLFITILAIAGGRQRISVSQWLVVLFAVGSGLYAARNLPVSSILLTLMVAPVAGKAIAEAGDGSNLAPRMRRFFFRFNSLAARMENLELHFRSHFWLALGLGLGLWTCMHGGRFGSIQYIHAYFDEQRFPVESADLIAERNVREPIFCPDSWGGYLIYRLYPQVKIVVDDRHDLYGERFFKEYLKVMQVESNWEGVLNDMHVNWVVAPTNSPLVTIMKVTPRWIVIHEDTTSVLFHRAQSP